MKIYINGEFFDRDSARVSVFDHGLLYGDGVFEGLRVYGSRVFRLAEHIERLYASAKYILLEMTMSEDKMAKAVEKTVSLNHITNGYVRLIVTRGEGSLGIDPSSCETPTVIIIAGGIHVYPEELYRKGMAIVTASSRRIAPDSLEPRVKSLNYLNNILARLEARQAGCQEAVMLNADGYVAECTVDNIFVVKSGRLMTPSPHQGALEGITMETVLELARKMEIDCDLSPLTRYDLYTADECFLTGTGAEIMPVTMIDGRTIGNGQPGTLTMRLEVAYRELVMAESA